jgi:hypothetical protein
MGRPANSIRDIMKRTNKALIAALATVTVSAAQADIVYDGINGQGFSINDQEVKALADDIHMQGPVNHLTGATIRLFNNGNFDNDITLNIYSELNPGAGWTKGSLLGSATTHVTDNNGTQVPVSFALDLDVFSEDLVAEVVLPGPSDNMGMFVNINPIVGSSVDRICEDDAYVTYGGGIQSNMAIQLEAAPVPEPASLVALTLGGIGLIRRRRARK